MPSIYANYFVRTKESICIRKQFNSHRTSVFSLNFSSTGKVLFMASKAKKMSQMCTFLGVGRGIVEEGHGFDLAVTFRS